MKFTHETGNRNGRPKGLPNRATLQTKIDTLALRLDLIAYILRDDSLSADERLEQVAMLVMEARTK